MSVIVFDSLHFINLSSVYFFLLRFIPLIVCTRQQGKWFWMMPMFVVRKNKTH